MGTLINQHTSILEQEGIKSISGIYHHLRNIDGKYEYVNGFCYSDPISDVGAKGYLLKPDCYEGLLDEEKGFYFAERFAFLKK